MFRPEHARTDTFAWPPGALEACSRFRQGHVVANAAIAYAVDAQRPVTVLSQDNTNGRSGLVGVRDDLGYALITTQTCDLSGKRGKKFPFFQVAPVYNIAGNVLYGQEPLIRSDSLAEFVLLTSEQFVRDGELWVADLRFETAVEKGLLIDRQPIEAFATEEGYRGCSRKIAKIRYRVAMDDKVEEYILKPLRAKYESHELDHSKIVDVVVRATPKVIEASAVRVYIIVDDDTDVNGLQMEYDQFQIQIAPKLPPGLTLLGIEVRSATQFTWADYRGADVIDLAYLSDGEEAGAKPG